MFICMQKINFIPHFFLKILQRNSKIVPLGNLNMIGHILLKWQYQFGENFDIYLQAKKKIYPSSFPWDIAKIIRVIRAWLATHTQSDTINLSKTFMFICRQKVNFIPTFCWRYYKDIQTSYLGYFGHV